MQNTIFKHNLLTCTDKYTSATRDPFAACLPLRFIISLHKT